MKKPKGWCSCGRYVTLMDDGAVYRHLDRGTDDWCAGSYQLALAEQPAHSVQAQDVALIAGLSAQIEAITADRNRLAAQRAEAVVRLHDRGGLTYREIGALVGLSSPRISQIAGRGRR